ncbi:putative disease resistance protein-like isoform X1 [Capsicum annuum]|nr:putative disease resistance protein-like isoform X1 [Capsicum annuum]KAF3648641.1 putative disease resistance protein-like isoform X1 [Capsicum annuum]
MRQLAPNSSEMSASQSPSHTPPPEIPLEIISEEEMAIIEAAFAAAATRSLVSSRASASSSSASSAASFQKNVRSIKSITLLSKRSFSNSSCSQSDTGVIVDVEDSGRLMTQKRNRIVDSLLHRYRRNRGLTVTDITATCSFYKREQNLGRMPCHWSRLAASTAVPHFLKKVQFSGATNFLQKMQLPVVLSWHLLKSTSYQTGPINTEFFSQSGPLRYSL